MPRPRTKKRSVRLSVTLEENEYVELTRLAAGLDLSAAWMIRRAVSEFIGRHCGDGEAVSPMRQAPKGRTTGKKAADQT